MVQFEIDPLGRVINRATKTQSTFEDDWVDLCVREIASTWRFPPPQDGGVIARKTIVFDVGE